MPRPKKDQKGATASPDLSPERALQSVKQDIESSETMGNADIVKLIKTLVKAVGNIDDKLTNLTTQLTDEMNTMKSDQKKTLSEMSTLKEDQKTIMNELEDIQVGLGKRIDEIETKTNKIDYRLHDQQTLTANMAGDLRALGERVLDMEWREIKDNMRLHNVPVHPDAKEGTETDEQTKQQVTDFFNQLEIKDTIGQFSCIRFKNRNQSNVAGAQAKTTQIPQIQLRLSAPWQRGEIFRALRKNGNKTKVSVQVEYPASLTKLKRELVKKGNELARTKNIKYRVAREGRTLVLMIKGLNPQDPDHWIYA